ncbi:murein hydrolase activator EnvC family protein [Stenoxybacter acetivorans]|uniref:murein hydrolase activator EnvC family protein n=1 Tax=Stenoxybacter acetivorans TaxID=422441 RepID=UPI00068B89EE|nr:peptidoglycan DD-metalloendopeptidase family protein [Stenoxybacter acetivorans]
MKFAWAAAWFYMVLLALMPSFTSAANGAQDLQSIQKAITATQKQIRQTAAEQKKVDAAISQAQNKLNKISQELAQLNQQHERTWQQAQRLRLTLEKLKTEIEEAQTQVARLLNAHYRNRAPNALAVFLQTDKIPQKERNLEYIRYINQANENVIARLYKQQQQWQKNSIAANEQLKKLSALQQQKKQALNQLSNLKDKQITQSKDLAKQISTKNQQLAKLKKDESRLSGLIAKLATQEANLRKAETKKTTKTTKPKPIITAETEKKTDNAPASEQNNTDQAANASVKPSQSAENNNKTNKTNKTTVHGLTTEDLALSPTSPNSPSAASKTTGSHSFSARQGQMKRPVNGHIAGYFGRERPNGGVWKGLYITTSPTAVNSIAAGKVVYAAALQGYGNTVIIDHGSDYVSVYSGLGSIAVRKGVQVKAQQYLGQSDHLDSGEPGIYFEIRYQNRVMNPLSWVS